MRMEWCAACVRYTPHRVKKRTAVPHGDGDHAGMPHPLYTPPGQLAAATAVGTIGLWLVAPDARAAIDQAAPILCAALPAFLTGAFLRLGIDTAFGQRVDFTPGAAQRLLIMSMFAALATLVALRIFANPTPDDLLGMLCTTAAYALIVLSAVVGLDYGDDDTYLRARHRG